MYDLLIKNVKLVRPNKTTVEMVDIAISHGKNSKNRISYPCERGERSL